MSSGKKTLGRQKIEMKRMTNESNLKVTFSKRRNGLFKKASELSTLCGVDIALIVFSPGQRVYSFGYPNVDAVIDRYLSQVPNQNNGTLHFIEAERTANVRELNTVLTEINNMMDAEKKRGEELVQILNMTEAQYWWTRPFDGMNLDQLEVLKKNHENMKNLIAQHANRHVIQGAPTQIQPFLGGNGSYSNTYPHYQPNHQQAQFFQPFFDGNGSSSSMSLPNQQNLQQTQFFENPMLQPQVYGFNNMRGEGGGYGPSGFY
jgi:hypothetical protein